MANLSPAANPSKSFKEPAEVTPELPSRVSTTFNLLSFAPKYNNLYPFYFQTGLVYEGLYPDPRCGWLMFAIAGSSYSCNNIQSLQADGVVNQPNYTIVLEWDYRVRINKWAHFQPFVQYIVQPNGTGNVQNATILGFALRHGVLRFMVG